MGICFLTWSLTGPGTDLGVWHRGTINARCHWCKMMSRWIEFFVQRDRWQRRQPWIEVRNDIPSQKRTFCTWKWAFSKGSRIVFQSHIHFQGLLLLVLGRVTRNGGWNGERWDGICTFWIPFGNFRGFLHVVQRMLQQFVKEICAKNIMEKQW